MGDLFRIAGRGTAEAQAVSRKRECAGTPATQAGFYGTSRGGKGGFSARAHSSPDSSRSHARDADSTAGAKQTVSAIGASLVSRLASLLYECLLVLAVLALTFAFPHILIGLFAHRAAATGLLWGHLFLVLFLYFGWFWRHGGQTLAMKTWRIRLVTNSGAPLSPHHVILRYLLAWPSIGLFGLGILWSLIDRDRQFLHDRLAGTRLIKTTT